MRFYLEATWSNQALQRTGGTVVRTSAYFRSQIRNNKDVGGRLTAMLRSMLQPCGARVRSLSQWTLPLEAHVSQSAPQAWYSATAWPTSFRMRSSRPDPKRSRSAFSTYSAPAASSVARIEWKISLARIGNADA